MYVYILQKLGVRRRVVVEVKPQQSCFLTPFTKITLQPSLRQDENRSLRVSFVSMSALYLFPHVVFSKMTTEFSSTSNL